MEGFLFALDVALVIYLCWHFYRMDRKKPGTEDRTDLGVFSYQDKARRP